MTLLPGRELGRLAPQSSLGLCDLHPLASARTNEVRLELRHHGESVQQAHRIEGVVGGAANAELHPFAVSSSTMSLASRNDRADDRASGRQVCLPRDTQPARCEVRGVHDSCPSVRGRCGCTWHSPPTSPGRCAGPSGLVRRWKPALIRSVTRSCPQSRPQERRAQADLLCVCGDEEPGVITKALSPCACVDEFEPLTERFLENFGQFRPAAVVRAAAKTGAAGDASICARSRLVIREHAGCDVCLCVRGYVSAAPRYLPARSTSPDVALAAKSPASPMAMPSSLPTVDDDQAAVG